MESYTTRIYFRVRLRCPDGGEWHEECNRGWAARMKLMITDTITEEIDRSESYGVVMGVLSAVGIAVDYCRADFLRPRDFARAIRVGQESRCYMSRFLVTKSHKLALEYVHDIRAIMGADTIILHPAWKIAETSSAFASAKTRRNDAVEKER